MNELIIYLKKYKRYKLNSIRKFYLTQDVQNVLDKYNLTLYELCYRIQHNIPLNKVFICKHCGKPVGLNATHGYKTFCNNKCQTEYIANSNNIKEKRKQTCLKKYGVDNCTKTELCRLKMKKTNYSKYGVFNYAKTNECKEKIKQTNLKKYGVTSYTKTDECQKKIKQTCLDKYGVDSYSKTQEYKDRFVKTNLNKYGVDNYSKTELAKQKIYGTKKKNNSFHTSKEEDKVYNLLLTKFNKNDIIRQYKSDLYPFSCDFYIKSLDLYIEYNGTWTHGWNNSKCLGSFNKNNKEHLRVLASWKSKNTKFYKTAIYTWTDLDVRKLETFRRNNLNYKIFWNLEEVKDWMEEPASATF